LTSTIVNVAVSMCMKGIIVPWQEENGMKTSVNVCVQDQGKAKSDSMIYVSSPRMNKFSYPIHILNVSSDVNFSLTVFIGVDIKILNP